MNAKVSYYVQEVQEEKLKGKLIPSAFSDYVTFSSSVPALVVSLPLLTGNAGD